MVLERGAVDVIINVILHVLLALLALMCLLPFIHVAAVSLSEITAVSTHKVGFWPEGFNLDNYRYIVMSDRTFLRCAGVSVLRVLVGVSLGLLITVVTAYPLSRDNIHMPGRTAIKTLMIFGMMFSAGFIPTYLSLNNLHLIDKFAVLVVPGAFNIFNTILVMNYFRGLPNELYESAALDGANHFQVLVSIFLPLSKPVLATVTLFSAIGHWNSWFDGYIYIKDVDRWPLQSYLYGRVTSKILEKMAGREAQHGASGESLFNVTPEGLSNAMILVAAIPILLAYPFLQRYFVSGLTLGAIKE